MVKKSEAETSMGGVDTQGGASAVLVTSPDVTAADGDPREPSTVVGVTYSFDAETWLERWGIDRERAVAVSAGEKTRSAAVATRTESAPGDAGDSHAGVPTQVDTTVVETVASERDVGEVGAIVHEYLHEWAGHEPTVYVDGLESIVDATDAEVAFRFLHVLVARVDEAGGRVVVSLDADAAPQHVTETFSPLFDERV
jgi:hypothetical protein